MITKRVNSAIEDLIVRLINKYEEATGGKAYYIRMGNTFYERLAQAVGGSAVEPRLLPIKFNGLNIIVEATDHIMVGGSPDFDHLLLHNGNPGPIEYA